MKIPAFFAALALLLALTACGTAPGPELRHPDYARIDRDVRAVCAVAMPLAPMAGPYGVFIIGGCATEAGIAKLASDPSSVEWLQGMVAKVKAHG